MALLSCSSFCANGFGVPMGKCNQGRGEEMVGEGLMHDKQCEAGWRGLREGG